MSAPLWPAPSVIRQELAPDEIGLVKQVTERFAGAGRERYSV